jgi:hypothetical protein
MVISCGSDVHRRVGGGFDVLTVCKQAVCACPSVTADRGNMADCVLLECELHCQGCKLCLVSCVLFKSNWMYNILFSCKVFSSTYFRSYLHPSSEAQLQCAIGFFMVLVCLFHGAGTGVGTQCHFSTVSFRLVREGLARHVHPVGFE